MRLGEAAYGDVSQLEEGGQLKATELGIRHGQDAAEKQFLTETSRKFNKQTLSVSQQQKTRRIATLDVFRGLTVAVMILVDDAGGEWSRINHSPWNGCTLADLVMPFFLFIVGVSIALALKKIPNMAPAVKKVILRTLKLIFWGILLQGGYSHAPDRLTYGVDMEKIRWCGILQRIALSYFVVALIEIATTKTRSQQALPDGPFGIFQLYRWHWLSAICILIIYFSCTYGVYVPDWHFVSSYNDTDYGQLLMVQCGVRAHFNQPCNAVGYIDRKVLGLHHLYQKPEWTRSEACDAKYPEITSMLRDGAPNWCRAPFEPEGILSSISAILSTILGVHYGHVLIHYKGHQSRLKHWIIAAFALIALGIVLHFSNAIPLNKQLYSFSYVCFTGGAAGLVFSGLYILIDVYKVRWPTLLLEWMGMNAMLVYVMAAEGIFPGFINGWYYKTENNTLVHWIQKHIFINVWHSRRIGILLYVLFAEILFWCLVSGLLHWHGIYWKL